MTTKITQVDHLVVHCAATPPSMDIGAKEIDLWHRQRGWNGIGYHFVIRRNGVVEAGRATDIVGSHAVGFNLRSLSFCLIGGVDKAGAEGKPAANFTSEQLASLRDLLTAWLKVWPKAEVVGHRELPSRHARLKACPSFDVKQWVADGMPTDPTKLKP
jgi:N-acetylmuramoyl-L-alanine amidase